MRILIVGASGYIGGRLVPAARGAGPRARPHEPRRAAARRPLPGRDGRGRRPPRAVDPRPRPRGHRRRLLPGPLDGRRRARLRRSRSAGGAQLRPGRVRGPASPRIVYLGGLGRRRRQPVAATWPAGTRPGAELAAHGVPVTEFRAAIIIGSGSASFEILRHLTERLPIMITPRWVGTRCQPIGIRDVLDYLVGALDHPEVTGVVEIGGPDILSYGDMMRTYARLRGLRRLMIPVPVLTPRLSSYWVSLVSPGAGAGSRGRSSRACATRSSSATRGPAAAFGLRPLPYDGALQRAIDRSRSPRRRVDLVRRARGARTGRASPSLTSHEGMIIERRQRGRRRAARARLRRGRAARRRGGLAVRERPVAHPRPRRSPRRRRRHAPGAPRTRPSCGSATRSTSGGSRTSGGRPCSACGRR